MANAQMGPINTRFVDKRRGRTQDGATIVEANNMDTISELRARLQVLAAGTYTNAVLDLMTTNDMLFALRTLSADSAGI